MSVFWIKIIAITAMLIDHIGVFFFPEVTALRAVGRIAFPLFAWLIANGAKHSKNVDTYIMRLLIFGLISQIPFFLVHQQIEVDYVGLNVMFTLALGLLGIKVLKEMGDSFKAFMLISVFANLAFIIDTDYGFLGVLSVIFFFRYFDDFRSMIISQTVLFVIAIYTLVFLGIYESSNLLLIQPAALLALPVIKSYNGKPGRRAKYLFYAVYPLQFLVIYLLLL